MAHVHDHDHDADTYYLDQLCLVGLSGLFAVVCLTMYFGNTEMLNRLLAPQFHLFVLLSGIALSVLVVIRSVALWRQSGQAAGHTHAHGHDHGHHHHHDHDHAHCDHDHDHAGCDGHEHTHEHSHEGGAGHSHGHTHEHGHGADHDHAWAPWRYVVLLVPIMLFFLGLPSRGLNVQAAQMDTSREPVGWAGLAMMGPSPLQQAAAIGVLTIDQGAREVRIVLDGKEAALDELKPGMPVVVRRVTKHEFRKPVIEEVIAGSGAAEAAHGSPSVVGEVESVNAADKELVVKRKDTGKPEPFDLGMGPAYNIDFKNLEALAYNPLLQKDWQGKAVRVLGQFAPGNNRQFTLARFRMQCCGADAVQVNLPVVLAHGTLDDVPSRPQKNDWVAVKGRVDFRKMAGRAGEVTVLVVPRPRYIQKSPPDPDPYIR